MDRRDELLGWIAGTRRNQQRLAVLLAVLTAVAFALWAWRPEVGKLSLGLVVVLAVCGFWITASHLADFRGKLAELERVQRDGGRDGGRAPGRRA